MSKTNVTESSIAQPATEHILSEIEMQFASNRKVLEPAVYQALEDLARDGHVRAMELMLQAA